MRFLADRTTLINGIATVIRAVPSHTPMPILECIHIEADPVGLVLTANDTRQCIQTRIPATVDEGGEIAVDAKMFSDIVKKMPSDDISFVTDEKFTVTLKSGRSKFAVPGRDGAEFTGLPEISAEKSFTISQATLKSMIQDTIFSVGANESMQILMGELISVEDDTFAIEALDGHRIAIRTYPLNEHAEEMGAVVPGKAPGDISRIISGDPTEEVTISIAQNHVRFDFNDTVMTVRLLDGKFPDTSSIIKDAYTTKVVANRNEVMACTERAGLFVRDNDKKPIILNITDGEVNFSISSPMGQMSESLDVITEGDDLEIGFNPRFLLDAMRAVPDDEVSMYLTNAKSPCFIRDSEKSYNYVILPVNYVK